MHIISVPFYNISIRLYWLGILLASPFNYKAKLWLQGRKNQYSGLGKLNSLSGKRYWFHCASLGEFEQARPLMEMIKTKHYHSYFFLSIRLRGTEKLRPR
jgi:3-deoxy-D-manno-octulosonic-acid transferase